MLLRSTEISILLQYYLIRLPPSEIHWLPHSPISAAKRTSRRPDPDTTDEPPNHPSLKVSFDPAGVPSAAGSSNEPCKVDSPCPSGGGGRGLGLPGPLQPAHPPH